MYEKIKEPLNLESELEPYKKPSRKDRLRTIKNFPEGFVVRKIHDPAEVERSEELFHELHDRYGLDIADHFLVRDVDRLGKEIVYQATQNLEKSDFKDSGLQDIILSGVQLERFYYPSNDQDEQDHQVTEDRDHFRSELRKLFENLTTYILDKYDMKEDFLWDIFKLDQYVYARRLYDTDYKIYLVDKDPYIAPIGIQSDPDRDFKRGLQVVRCINYLLETFTITKRSLGDGIKLDDLELKLKQTRAGINR